VRECKHPTCGEKCRREKKQKKAYVLKRTPLKRKAYKIKPVADKRRKQNQSYSVKRRQFLDENPYCQINAPGCTRDATEVHHTNGRENERLLIVEDWKASCSNCNGKVEEMSEWAYENGHKKKKHGIYERKKY